MSDDAVLKKMRKANNDLFKMNQKLHSEKEFLSVIITELMPFCDASKVPDDLMQTARVNAQVEHYRALRDIHKKLIEDYVPMFKQMGICKDIVAIVEAM